MSKVTVKAPASTANLNVAFDHLGFAIEGVYDKLQMYVTQAEKLRIERINTFDLDGKELSSIPTDPKLNTASIAAYEVFKQAGDSLNVEIDLFKGIPLSSGMGGSASRLSA